MSLKAALVGATGFVGSNLKSQTTFCDEFSSKNIDSLAGKSYDLVACAGAPATMWMANRFPDEDAANLDRLFHSLSGARIGRIVLISTIAVYADASSGPTETSTDFETETPYGKHRRMLEERVVDGFPEHHIIRLPSLFGPGLKKNFLYDLINPIPSFLTADKLRMLEAHWTSAEQSLAARYLEFDEKSGMYRFVRDSAAKDGATESLESSFEKAGFVAPMFANGASEFQYYNLANIWADINATVENGLRYVNFSSTPVSAGKIATFVAGKSFQSSDAAIVREDMRTVHAPAFGKLESPYLYSEDEILADMRDFYAAERRR